MAAPYPQFLPQAFATGAAGPDRNTIPDAPVTAQRASWQLGFPPQTMTPVVAGGKPMLGPDMNGALYMMSTHAVYAQTGQPYRYSADVVASLGGYAVGTLLGSADGSTLWYNSVALNTTDPDAGGAGWVGILSYGVTTIPGLTAGVRALTAAEAAKNILVLSGALVGNVQIVVPNQVKRWLVVNSTTGAFATTVKTAAGSGVAIPQGGFNAPVEVWSDSINVYNAVAPVNLPIDQNPTGLTIAQRTNAGYLYATYFNQNSPLENFAISALFAEVGGDGFHRKISLTNFQPQVNVGALGGTVTNAQVPQAAVTQHSAAVLANAALTGVPTAPTAAAGTATMQVASTAFVNRGASLSPTGYFRLPSGHLVQYGHAVLAAGSPGSIGVAFPIAFTAVYMAVCCTANRISGGSSGWGFVNSLGLTSMGIVVDENQAGTAREGYWIAIGQG